MTISTRKRRILLIGVYFLCVFVTKLAREFPDAPPVTFTNMTSNATLENVSLAKPFLLHALKQEPYLPLMPGFKLDSVRLESQISEPSSWVLIMRYRGPEEGEIAVFESRHHPGTKSGRSLNSYDWRFASSHSEYATAIKGNLDVGLFSKTVFDTDLAEYLKSR